TLGDGGQMKHRVSFHLPVVAQVLAERTFRLPPALLVEIAFENDLRVGGNHQVVGDALDQRHRLAAQPPMRAISSSIGARLTALMLSVGCEPMTKAIGMIFFASTIFP